LKQKQKKQCNKKIQELLNLGVNLDEVLKNARKNKLKRKYQDTCKEENDIEEPKNYVEEPKIVIKEEPTQNHNWFKW